MTTDPLATKAAVFSKLLLQASKLANQTGDTKKFILFYIKYGPMTVSHIAKLLGFSRQSIQRTADHLVREGFCSYEQNFFHRRAKLLSLTSKGREVLLDELKSGQEMIRIKAHAISIEMLAKTTEVLELLNG